MLRPIRTLVFAALAAVSIAAEPREIGGIYPHLATFNDEGECGTGAVVPWADRLRVISCAPHKPQGSTDKLYEITPDLAVTELWADEQRKEGRHANLPGYIRKAA